MFVFSMHLTTTTPHPLNSTHLSSKPIFLTFPPKCRRKAFRHRRPTVLASSSDTNSNPEGFFWLQISHSIRSGSKRFFNQLQDSVKKETGFDFEDAKVKVEEFSGRAVDSAKNGQILLQRFQSELFPEFLNWNKFEYWKVKFSIFLSNYLQDFVLTLTPFFCPLSSGHQEMGFQKSWCLHSICYSHGIFLSKNLYGYSSSYC